MICFFNAINKKKKQARLVLLKPFLHISVLVTVLSVPGCTAPAGECMLF